MKMSAMVKERKTITEIGTTLGYTGDELRQFVHDERIRMDKEKEQERQRKEPEQEGERLRKEKEAEIERKEKEKEAEKQREMEENERYGPVIGGCAPLVEGELGPNLTQCGKGRGHTCVPSFILIRPTVWTQSRTSQTGQTQTDKQRSDSIGRQTVAQLGLSPLAVQSNPWLDRNHGRLFAMSFVTTLKTISKPENPTTNWCNNQLLVTTYNMF